MERRRFDELTKALATGASRRSVLKGMLGGVAAGAGITVVPQVAGAQDDVCIEPGGDCEMVDGATPCCGSYTCSETICDNARGCWEVEDECDAEYPCCDDTLTCVDGACVEAAAGGEDDVDTLPSTGAGPDAGSGNWAGAVAAGGAAAAAALLLRKEKRQTDDTSA